ncbi:MAG: DUF3990 domain-containing protein [Fibromonadales bacterium]|nr:DUF3990 domain-containing protein [Fibromonadales bacterium]
MQVFHGSNIKIEKIDIAKSEYYRDFGRGFYVTKIRKHAKQRAVETVKKQNSGKPIVTEFKYFEHYPETVKQFHFTKGVWGNFYFIPHGQKTNGIFCVLH